MQLQLQLQLLRYTTLHPGVVSEVTAATIATTPKSTTPTTFGSISGFALPYVSHSKQPTLPISFLFLKLPPPPCAVLLVHLCFNRILQVWNLPPKYWQTYWGSVWIEEMLCKAPSGCAFSVPGLAYHDLLVLRVWVEENSNPQNRVNHVLLLLLY